MNQITKDDTQSMTQDIVKTNIEHLKSLFPEVFSEDRIDFEALESLLGEYIDKEDERYSFNWKGKANARRIAQTPSTATLRPAKEESKNWDKTENLYIEGDNLEVLKLLQKSYHKKVKMIYIDPPYNTGNDFVYSDDFSDTLQNYLNLTGQINEVGKKVSTNSETSGRYHSAWLNMMYPRIKLARNLLKEDGLIFISIDDNELHNLRKLCDEVFGEDNFLGCAIRVGKKTNNQGEFWAPNADYILTYASNRNLCTPFFGGVNYDAYKTTDNEGKRKGEKYQLVRLYMTSLDPLRGCTNQRYYIECPDGSLVIPPGSHFPTEKKHGSMIVPQTGDDKVWRWTYTSFEENRDKIVIKKVKSSNLVDQDGNPAKWNVFTKTYLNDVIENSSAKPNSLIEDHINQISSHELNALSIPFDFAKPTTLIKYLTEISKTKGDEIILDFFSGSGTTGDAVMRLNSIDGAKRRFILVQLPEKTKKDSDEFKKGFTNICEIGKERIRRAGDKIVEELKEKQSAQKLLTDEVQINPDDLDIGFKVFKLDTSNIKTWDSSSENIQQALLDSVSNIKSERSQEDVLYEVLLKYGLDLTLPIEEFEQDGKKLYSVGFGSLIICLDDDIDISIAEKIVEIKDKKNPETMNVIFKDNGFKDDVVKTNTIQLLTKHGVESVRSI